MINALEHFTWFQNANSDFSLALLPKEANLLLVDFLLLIAVGSLGMKEIVSESQKLSDIAKTTALVPYNLSLSLFTGVNHGC